MEITYEELLAEFERLQVKDDDPGLTAQELSEAWGIPRRKVYDLLRQAETRGLLEVGRKKVRTLSGGMQKTPCYRLKKTKKRRSRKS